MTDPQLLGSIAALTEPEHTVLLQLLREAPAPLSCGHHPLFLDQPRGMLLSLESSVCRVCAFLKKGGS